MGEDMGLAVTLGYAAFGLFAVLGVMAFIHLVSIGRHYGRRGICRELDRWLGLSE
jgi:hypothetical protein